MHDLNDEELKNWKEHLGKLYKRELSDDEVREAAFNLTGFFRVLIEVDREQHIVSKDENKLDLT